MSDERKLILNLLSEGKITAEEADELLEALDLDAASRQDDEDRVMPSSATDEAKGPDAGKEAGKDADKEADGSQKGTGAKAEGAKAEDQNAGRHWRKTKLEVGPDLEERLGSMAEDLEDLVSDIPEKVQKALDSVTITKDGKKSTLTDLLKSWGISELGGISANPSFRMGTADVKDRLPVSVSLTNGAIRFLPNEDGTDIKVLAKVLVRNAPREEVQKIANKHIEVYFDPKAGLKVKSIDSLNVSVASVEVYLPKSLDFDISAQSVNGAVKLIEVSAKGALLKTVNGSVQVTEAEIGMLEAQAVNGSVKLDGKFMDVNAGTVNGSVRANMILAGGTVRLSSGNGSVRAGIDENKSVPMQIQASSRHGAVKMGLEGLETVQESSINSMHKSGTWRSRGYLDAKVKSDVEIETRNGSVVITED